MKIIKPVYVRVRIRAVCMSETVVFEFAEFSDLSEFLVNIESEKLNVMRLYHMGKAFFLAVPKDNIPIVIYEYSVKNSRACYAEGAVSEYGKPIAAGDELVDFARMIKKIK